MKTAVLPGGSVIPESVQRTLASLREMRFGKCGVRHHTGSASACHGDLRNVTFDCVHSLTPLKLRAAVSALAESGAIDAASKRFLCAAIKYSEDQMTKVEIAAVLLNDRRNHRGPLAEPASESYSFTLHRTLLPSLPAGFTEADLPKNDRAVEDLLNELQSKNVKPGAELRELLMKALRQFEETPQVSSVEIGKQLMQDVQELFSWSTKTGGVSYRPSQEDHFRSP